MKKQKNFQIATLSVLAFAILFMAIGFAAYSRTLYINGTANVKKSAWSVHWDTAKFQEGTGTGHQNVTSYSFTDDTHLTFVCDLPEPKTFCSFTIDAVNEGTYDAKLKSIEMTKTVSPTNANLDQFFSYEIYYNGSTTPYTASNSSITGITLNKASVEGTTTIATRHPVVVRVEYKEPAEQYLPNVDHTVTLTANFDYEQITTNGS